MLAGMAFQASKTDEGRQLIETAIKASGNSAQAQSAAGQLLLDAGLYDEALSRFRGAMSADDKNPGYAFGAARAQLALGQREAARESLNRALAINPDWLPAVALMAQVELRDNRPDAALAQARRLEKNPKLAAAGFALEGDILMASGQAAGAADAYAQSAKLRPSAEAAVGEFRARRSANLAGPTDPLTKWLQRNPGDARVRFVLAGAYEQAGRLADAISEYEKVVQQQPDNVVAMNNLAWLYSQRKDPRAEALAKQAYAKAPNAAAVADTYGWILVQGGKVEDGLKILRQAHDLDRKIPEVEYHLGVALLKSGQKDEARRTLESAISQGKDAPWVGDARKALADAG
jgi:putative PEP-CTERM system TPR-repeat lipoprotein